jgi:hypothetical protein
VSRIRRGPPWIMSNEALHCLNCGYNLTGLSEQRCPECGEPFDPARILYLQRVYGKFRLRLCLWECLQPLWAFWIAHVILLVASMAFAANAEIVIRLCSGLVIMVSSILGMISCKDAAALWAAHARFRYRNMAEVTHLVARCGVWFAFYLWYCIVLGACIVVYLILEALAHSARPLLESFLA